MRNLGRLAPCAFLLGFLAATGEQTASADALEPGLTVRGSGTCPAPDAVKTAILQLTSERGRRALPPESVVDVIDRGDTYEVTVRAEGKTSRRVYADVARECERRERFAAVFAITTLIPPELAFPSEAELPPPPEPKKPRRAPPATRAPSIPSKRETVPTVRLELGAFGDVGVHPGDATRAATLGGELRVAVGRGTFAGTLAMAYAPEGRLTVAERHAGLERLMGTLGARARVLQAPLQVVMDLGLTGAVERTRGSDMLTPAQDSAFELGVRAGSVLTLSGSRGVTPFLDLHVSCFPVPRELTAAPEGSLGHMPLVWVGAALGAALGF